MFCTCIVFWLNVMKCWCLQPSGASRVGILRAGRPRTDKAQIGGQGDKLRGTNCNLESFRASDLRNPFCTKLGDRNLCSGSGDSRLRLNVPLGPPEYQNA